MSRPSKYRPKMVQEARDFFLRETNSGNYATIRGLGIFLGVDKEQIRNWEKLYPDFHAALEFGRDLGHDVLVKRALHEEFNPGFTKFLLVNNFGYMSENAKTENVNTHNFPTGINVNFISSDRS